MLTVQYIADVGGAPAVCVRCALSGVMCFEAATPTRLSFCFARACPLADRHRERGVPQDLLRSAGNTGQGRGEQAAHRAGWNTTHSHRHGGPRDAPRSAGNDAPFCASDLCLILRTVRTAPRAPSTHSSAPCCGNDAQQTHTVVVVWPGIPCTHP